MGDWQELPNPVKAVMVYRLKGDGLTCTEIAERFANCTKNSVIGLTNRYDEIGRRR